MIGWCWHRWSRWSKLRGDDNRVPYQLRECEKCGKVRIRTRG